MRSAVCVLESLILLLVPCVIACAKGDQIVFPRSAVAYVVASPSTKLEKRVVTRLTDYMAKVLGKRPIVKSALNGVPRGKPAIALTSRKGGSPIAVQVSTASEESYALVTGSYSGHPLAVCAALTDLGLKRAVQRLVILSQQEHDALVIPSTRMSESPWIRYREWTICPWDPEHVRGVFHNDSADKRMDIHRYSDRRLADYVEMFDWFGFSGCQLMEIGQGGHEVARIPGESRFASGPARGSRDRGPRPPGNGSRDTRRGLRGVGPTVGGLRRPPRRVRAAPTPRSARGPARGAPARWRARRTRRRGASRSRGAGTAEQRARYGEIGDRRHRGAVAGDPRGVQLLDEETGVGGGGGVQDHDPAKDGAGPDGVDHRLHGDASLLLGVGG